MEKSAKLYAKQRNDLVSGSRQLRRASYRKVQVANFRDENVQVIEVETLFACVECGMVSAVNRRRCPVCQHGPENSQPTYKPVSITGKSVRPPKWADGTDSR